MPSASVLATALSADSQSDSQTDSVPTPEPADSRRVRALLIACITIALERFAFYTLVSLFVLFLTERRGHFRSAGHHLVRSHDGRNVLHSAHRWCRR